MLQLTGALALLIFFVMVSAQQTSHNPTTDPSVSRYEQMAPKVSKSTSPEISRMTPSPAAETILGGSRIKKPRRRKGRKGASRKKKLSRIASYESKLRRLSSQNAADRVCQSWSPDLKVKVNITEVSIMVNYCADSASPKTQTCVREVNPSSLTTASSSECQILSQGNCTTVFRGLEEGKRYNITIKAYCRCEERYTDPCAVRRFFRGPYDIPVIAVTTQNVIAASSESGKDFFNENIGIILVSCAVFVVVVFGTPFLCWLRFRAKSSRDNSENVAPPRSANPSLDPWLVSNPPSYGDIREADSGGSDSGGSDSGGSDSQGLLYDSQAVLKAPSYCEDPNGQLGGASSRGQTMPKELYEGDSHRSCETVYYEPDGPPINTKT